jgi:LPXTG-motif cell wall-anchored protein
MRRTLTILGAGFAVLVLTAGPASAGERHHHHHAGCTIAVKCRPEPLPKPPGGWPCAETKSCDSKHHHPICPPKPPHKPPHGHKPPTHHRPPVVAHPRPPVLTHVVKTPVAADVPRLPRTGGSGDLVLAGGGLLMIAGGTALVVLTRRPKSVTDAIRGELA